MGEVLGLHKILDIGLCVRNGPQPMPPGSLALLSISDLVASLGTFSISVSLARERKPRAEMNYSRLLADIKFLFQTELVSWNDKS